MATSFRDGPASWVDNRDRYVEQYTGSAYIAIGAIARMAAMQKAKVLRRTEKKSGIRFEEVSPTHPLVELFEEVNPIDTPWDLWFYTIGWSLIAGNSYLYKAKNGFGTPKQLWPMPPQWVKVIPDPVNFIAGYEINSNYGSAFHVPKSYMIDIKQPALDWSDNGRYYGQPSIKAASTTLDLENEMLKRLYYQFKNFAPPGMVFETDQRLQQNQVQQIWAQMAAQHSMSAQTGRPMVLHSGMKLSGSWNSNSDRELSYTDSLDKTLEMTFATLGVPKNVVGLSQDQNRCLDEQTECLTASGWVRYDQLTESTEIACFDPDSGSLHYDVPSDINIQDYDGPMERWRNADSADILMTPNHRVLGRSGDGHRHGPLQCKHASEWSKGGRMQILGAPPNGAACTVPSPVAIPPAVHSKRGAYRDDATVRPEDFLEFTGWFVSEGHTSARKYMQRHKNGRAYPSVQYSTVLSQKKPQYVAEIDKLLDRMPFKWHRQVVAGVVRWTCSDKGLHDYLVSNCGKLAANKKAPSFIKSWPASSLKVFLTSALKGDGNFQESQNSWRASYTTISPQLADDIQEIAIKCGYRSRIGSPTRLTKNGCAVFTVSVLPRTPYASISRKSRSIEHYQGKVWCVTVPTSYFVVRRNGCVHITGNSNAEASLLTFAKMTVDPLLEQLSQHLTQDLARDFEPDRSLIIQIGPCEVDKGEALRQAIETMVRAGAITPNEVRHMMLELPPLESEHGDNPIMVSGFQQTGPEGDQESSDSGNPKGQVVEVDRSTRSGQNQFDTAED